MLGPRPSDVPAADDLALGNKLAGGLQAPRPNRISLKDDRFTLIMESGQVNPQVPPALSINAIIVGSNSHASRVFYDLDSFDADNPMRRSVGLITVWVRPTSRQRRSHLRVRSAPRLCGAQPSRR